MSMKVYKHEVILYNDDNKEHIDNSQNLEKKSVYIFKKTNSNTREKMPLLKGINCKMPL